MYKAYAVDKPREEAESRPRFIAVMSMQQINLLKRK